MGDVGSSRHGWASTLPENRSVHGCFSRVTRESARGVVQRLQPPTARNAISNHVIVGAVQRVDIVVLGPRDDLPVQGDVVDLRIVCGKRLADLLEAFMSTLIFPVSSSSLAFE